MGESVAQLCKVASIRHVANYFDLDWKTVKKLDFTSLQRELGPLDLDGLEVIGMDEFAIQKGHRYATVIVEPTGHDNISRFSIHMTPRRVADDFEL